jgi:DNA-directed RNA polymerase specialized sigma24 family protein
MTTSTVLYDEISDVNGDIGEIIWTKLHASLWPFARYLVYSFRVPSWQGQEEDIIADIVQETSRRVLERSQKAERGEASPIQSLPNMVMVVASNYCKDLRRGDRRLARIPSDDYSQGAYTYAKSMDEQVSFSDSATEHVYQESLFILLAHEIANFPDKQRRALLIDLANRMAFDSNPTPLQSAFLNEGIELRQYKQPLPDDPRERTQQTSLLNHAYKRVAHLVSVQEYVGK